MIRKGLLSSLVSICLASIFAVSIVSCNNKPKATDDSGAAVSDGETVEDKAVSQQTLTFDPNGSDSGTIALKTVNFEYDKSNLTQEARTLLDKNAKWIKEHTEVNVQVEGHCDERGSVEYNLSLGERRAQTVKRYLVSLGIASKRLSVISYGKEKLLDSGDSESAHLRNRRANFLPIPK